MSFLSLPFIALSNLQVVIRLKHGTLDDLAFSLEPFIDSASKSSTSASPSPIMSEPSPSLASVPYSISFQSGYDDKGPMLRVFASRTDSPATTPSKNPQGEENCDSAFRLALPPSNNARLDSHASIANNLPTNQDIPIDSNLLRWQYGLPDTSSAGNGVLPPSSNLGFDMFGFDSFGFNDPHGFLSLSQDQECDTIQSSSPLILPTPPASVATPLSEPTMSLPASPRPSSPFCHLVPEMLAEASSFALEEAERGRGRTAGGTSFKRRRFSCKFPGCNRRFTSQYTLKVHTDAHRPKIRPSFPCTLGCKEQFSRQHDRLRHEVAKHGRVCEYICNSCHRFFSSERTLTNHKCPSTKGDSKCQLE